MKSWKKFEYRIKDFLVSRGYKASRVPLSGSALAIKGDVIAEKGSLRLRIDAKSTRSGGRIRISRAALEKIHSEAGEGELPLVVFSFYRHRRLYAIVGERFFRFDVELVEKSTWARNSVGIAKEEVAEATERGAALLMRFKDDSTGYVVIELQRLLEMLEAEE